MTRGVILIKQKLKILRDLVFQEGRRQEKHSEMETLHPKVQFGLGSFADNHCSFGGLVNLAANAKLLGCTVGANTYISTNTKMMNCDIGSYCSIGANVMAGLGTHPVTTFVSTHPSFYSPRNNSPVSYVNEQKFVDTKRITIGNDVWIGAGVILIDGMTIGDGAIVAAGAVVTTDVRPYSIVGGIPAKEIRKRFTDDQISFLLALRWWDKGEEWIQAHAYLFIDIGKLMESLS